MDIDEELAGKLLEGEGRIYWATDSDGHGFFDEITPQEALLIQPRYQKTREEKTKRTGAKAEVFTPLSTVAEINMSLWTAGEGRDTVEARWLEACCGEGAFITTRYDALTGEEIPPEKRMGFLDMKLRLPNADPLLCLKSCFGFEWQGDSLFLARKNVLLTYLEAGGADIDEACRVIRTRLFQMDGISWRLPDPRFDVRVAKQKMKKPGALEGYCSSLGLKKVQIP